MHVYSIVTTAVIITAVCFIGFSVAATVGDTRTFLALGGATSWLIHVAMYSRQRRSLIYRHSVYFIVLRQIILHRAYFLFHAGYG